MYFVEEKVCIYTINANRVQNKPKFGSAKLTEAEISSANPKRFKVYIHILISANVANEDFISVFCLEGRGLCYTLCLENSTSSHKVIQFKHKT